MNTQPLVALLTSVEHLAHRFVDDDVLWNEQCCVYVFFPGDGLSVGV